MNTVSYLEEAIKLSNEILKAIKRYSIDTEELDLIISANRLYGYLNGWLEVARLEIKINEENK